MVLQAQIDKARRPQQLDQDDLVNWRDHCLNVNFTRWMNRSFQGPKRLRLNEICEEARNVPEWIAREALGKKSFPDKEMPGWIWISGIAATVTIGAMAAVAMRGRKRERDVEADADGKASPRKALRGSISHEPESTDVHVGSMSLPEVLCERLDALNDLNNGNDREAQPLDGIPTTARSADRPPPPPEDDYDVNSIPPSRATKQVYNAGKESASKSKSARGSKTQQTQIQTQTQLKTSQKTPSTRKRRFLDMDSDDRERPNECQRKRREAIEQQQRSLENWDHETLVDSEEAPPTLPNRESEELEEMLVFGLPPSHTTEDNIKTCVELNREDAGELSETDSILPEQGEEVCEDAGELSETDSILPEQGEEVCEGVEIQAAHIPREEGFLAASSVDLKASPSRNKVDCDGT